MKVDIINSALSALGQAPTDPLNTNNPYIKIALELYDKVDIRYQALGWWFNTRVHVKLTPDSNNQITKPVGALSLHPHESGYTIKGNLIIGAHDGSDTFSEPIELSYVERVDADELPPTYEAFITYALTMEVLINLEGEDSKINYYRVLRDEAYGMLERVHLRNRRHKIGAFKSLGGEGYASRKR